MKTSLSAMVPDLAVPLSAAPVAVHGKPGESAFSLPPAGPEMTLKPRTVPVRNPWPPGSWRLATQPAAFRGFGINE